MSNTIFVLPSYTINDPPTHNIILSLVEQNYFVKVIQQVDKNLYINSFNNANVKIINIFKLNTKFRIFNSLYNWFNYWFHLNYNLIKDRPSLLITFMFHPLAAIPNYFSYKAIACIYDIPVMSQVGKLDRRIINNAINKIKNVKFLWTSDPFKSKILMSKFDLRTEPEVCYNTPRLDYYNNLSKEIARKWIIENIINENIIKHDPNLIIITRAGAIGSYGGIEETIETMRDLPKNYIFILMGKIKRDFKIELDILRKTKGVQEQVYIIEIPSDEIWKKVILGSDIGHLLHLPFKDKDYNEAYSLNSVLSANRLFQYMAARLSILIYDDDRLDELKRECNCFYTIKSSNVTQELRNILSTFVKPKQNQDLIYEKCKQLFISKYNWEFQSKNILNNILNEHKQ